MSRGWMRRSETYHGEVRRGWTRDPQGPAVRPMPGRTGDGAR